MRNRSATLIRISVLLALIAAIAWKADITGIQDQIHLQSLLAVIALQPAIFVGLGLSALRLKVLLRSREVTTSRAFKAQVLAYGCNLIIPGRGSELLKITYLHDHANVSITAGFAAIFLERAMDIIFLGILASAALSMALLHIHPAFAVAPVTVAFALIVIGTRWRKGFLRLIDRLPFKTARTFILELSGHVSATLEFRGSKIALIYGVLIWVSAFLGVVIFFKQAGSVDIGMSGALVVLIASIVGSAIPALPAGLGTYEAAVVLTLRGLGYEYDEAVPLALLLHASQIILSVFAAMTIIAFERLGIRALYEQVRKLPRTDGGA